MSTPLKLGPVNFIMSTSIRSVERPSSSEAMSFSGSEFKVKSAVGQVHAYDAERLLLLQVLFVQHVHVEDDLGRCPFGLSLELDPHPAVAFIIPLVAPGGDGIGEGEERGLSPRPAPRRSTIRSNS